MGSHPLNLALRFALEMAALAALCLWGWQQFDGLLAWAAAASFPALFMVLWGTFAVPEDPSRGGRPVLAIPGSLRLVLELALFAWATWALGASEHPRLSPAFGATVALHYLLSWDRIRWLLRH